MKPVLLIIDDNGGYRSVITTLCQVQLPHIHVLTATNGAEGLRLAATESPGVVLLDVQLPDMDGFEVCRRLKSDPATAAAHVLMMSGVYLDQEDRIHGIQSGADGYLRKPFEAAELLVQIQALFRWWEFEKTHREHLEKLVAQRTAALKDRDLTVEFLRLINASNSASELIRAVTVFFQRYFDWEAVGVRLSKGEDYPYFEARGFPQEFVALEMSLCNVDEEGRPRRDEKGKCAWECLCGRVIAGEGDFLKDTLTPAGSFWTNDAPRWVNSLSPEERRHLRGRCVAEGYRSLALVPLSLGKRRLGLLQFNDKRPNRLSPELISLWECLAGHLAVGLAKFEAEGALRESDRMLKAIMEYVPEGIAIGDAQDLHFRMASKTGLELSGRNPQETITLGQYLEQATVFHADGVTRATVEELPLSRAVKKGEVVLEEEWLIEHPDGKRIPVSCNAAPIRDENGVITGGILAYRDISSRRRMEAALREARDKLEQRVEERTAELQAANTRLAAAMAECIQAEEAARQSEQRSRLLFETMLQGVIYRDTAGRIVAMNSAAERILGKTLAELQGKTSEEIEYAYLREDGSPFPADEHPSMVALRTGRAVQGVVMQVYDPQRKDSRWIQVDAVPMFRPGDDRPSQVYTLFNDITERKEAEKKIKIYQGDLHELTLELLLAEENERKRIALALHDSVGQMLVVLKLKLDETLQNHPRTVLAKTLHGSVIMLEDVIKQIRTLTTDLSPPILYELGLGAALEWLSERFQAEYGVESSFKDGNAGVTLDTALNILLFQSVRELLANIGKHAKARHACLTVEENAGNLAIIVKDDGVGFDPQILQASRRRGEQSFGFFSVRERMLHIGGQMTVESEVGKGTTVILSVPLKPVVTHVKEG